MKFICPNCGNKLNIKENGVAVCQKGHSHDRSREGYYNLLLSGNGGVHGDNREMLLSRRRFLEGGAYLPLAEKLLSILSEFSDEHLSVLDMGCGEGYYTDFIEQGLRSMNRDFEISAFDISKDAVKLASKRNKNISFAVASSYKIPMEDGSIDAVFNVFSPLATEETRRVLKENGIFVFAVPGARHLWELKDAIYDKPYLNEQHETALAGFRLLRTENLSYRTNLDTSLKIADLFAMTPYAYRTGKTERERLLKIESLDCCVEFLIYVYQKCKL